jgi:PAS domain S-box-containing protein
MSTPFNEHDLRSKEAKSLLDDLEEIRRSASSIVSTLEREVVHNQSLLKTVAHLVGDSVLVVKDNAVHLANKQASKLLGLSESCLEGIKINELFPNILDALKSGEHEKAMQFQASTPERQKVNLTLTKISAPTHHSFVIVAREGNVVQECVNKGTCQFQSNIIDAVPTPLFYTDINGHAIHGSSSFYEMFGLSKQQMEKHTVTSLFSEVVGKLFSPREQFHATPERLELRVHLPWRNRDLHIVLLKTVFRNCEGKPIGHVATILDAATAPPALPKTSTNIVKILNGSDQPIAVTGWPNTRIVMANKAFFDYYGYNEKEVLGRHVCDFCLDETPKVGVMEEAFLHGEDWVQQVQSKRKDGSVSLDLIKVVPIMKDNVEGPAYCMFIKQGS